PPAPPRATRLEVTSALLAALHRAGVACRRQGRHLLVRLGPGQVGRVELDALYAAFQQGTQALGAHVEGLVARLSALGSRPDRGPDSPRGGGG
ncbi:MAG TPA: hypothetical protein VLQ93_11735, partial [Myxococcaceae bacterium]|nr:hypothetical protein [Myxococcaceae bacterium]